MHTKEVTKVIEFNTRFGDPETQVVLPLLENDLLQVIVDVMDNKYTQLKWKDVSCVGVVLVSKGYLSEYKKNVLIPTKEMNNDTFVVQAGTKKTDKGIVSNGGRVLLVGATGETLAKAAEKAYAYLTVYDETDDFFY